MPTVPPGGGSWSGTDAKRLGLVDSNLDFWGVVELAARENGLKPGGYRLLQGPVFRKGVMQSLSGLSTMQTLRKLIEWGHPLGRMLTGRVQAMLPYTVRYY